MLRLSCSIIPEYVRTHLLGDGGPALRTGQNRSGLRIPPGCCWSRPRSLTPRTGFCSAVRLPVAAMSKIDSLTVTDTFRGEDGDRARRTGSLESGMAAVGRSRIPSVSCPAAQGTGLIAATGGEGRIRRDEAADVVGTTGAAAGASGGAGRSNGRRRPRLHTNHLAAPTTGSRWSCKNPVRAGRW